MESLLSSESEALELEPSEVFLFTSGSEFTILSNRERFSSGSISITNLGGEESLSTKTNIVKYINHGRIIKVLNIKNLTHLVILKFLFRCGSISIYRPESQSVTD